MSDTIFGKIVRGEIPSEFLYEDEHCVAINDISPQAPVHVLVIPKRGIPRLVDAGEDDRDLLGHLLLAALTRFLSSGWIRVSHKSGLAYSASRIMP